MLKKQFFLLNWDIGIQRKLKDSGVMDAVTNMNVKKYYFVNKRAKDWLSFFHLL